MTLLVQFLGTSNFIQLYEVEECQERGHLSVLHVVWQSFLIAFLRDGPALKRNLYLLPVFDLRLSHDLLNIESVISSISSSTSSSIRARCTSFFIFISSSKSSLGLLFVSSLEQYSKQTLFISFGLLTSFPFSGLIMTVASWPLFFLPTIFCFVSKIAADFPLFALIFFRVSSSSSNTFLCSFNNSSFICLSIFFISSNFPSSSLSIINLFSS